jgi:hypothetical protein
MEWQAGRNTRLTSTSYILPPHARRKGEHAARIEGRVPVAHNATI